MLVLTCQCGQKMKVPPESVGKQCKCVKCAEAVTITEDKLTFAIKVTPSQ